MRVHSCLKAMKTEASVRVDAHCRRAPVPAMSPREELTRLQANRNPKLPAVRDSRSACKSILMDCRNESFQCRALLNDNTRNFIQALTELFSICKQRRAGKAAVVRAAEAAS